MNLEEARKQAKEVQLHQVKRYVLDQEGRIPESPPSIDPLPLAHTVLELADEVERLRRERDHLSIVETDLTTQLLDTETEVERLEEELSQARRLAR